VHRRSRQRSGGPWRWLANKTPEIVSAWIARPDNSVLVAVEGAAILAVGSITGGEEITLCYVSPDARFRGVSRALLGALEARAVERGRTRCTLHSTLTARRFYRADVEDSGPASRRFDCWLVWRTRGSSDLKKSSSLRAQRRNLVGNGPTCAQIAASPGGLLAMTGLLI
jgi:GNAT superfamily N-acetyltransferase